MSYSAKTKTGKQAKIPLDHFHKIKLICDIDSVENFFKDKEEKKIDKSCQDILPQFINDIIDQIRSLSNVKNEVKDWSVKYYSPSQLIEGTKKFKEESILIPSAEKGVAVRNIFTSTKEVFNICFKGRGVETEEKMYIPEDYGLSFILPMCNIVDVKINNMKYEQMPCKNGHRPKNIYKNPLSRHILVLDGWINETLPTDQVEGATGIDISSLINKE